MTLNFRSWDSLDAGLLVDPAMADSWAGLNDGQAASAPPVILQRGPFCAWGEGSLKCSHSCLAAGKLCVYSCIKGKRGRSAEMRRPSKCRMFRETQFRKEPSQLALPETGGRVSEGRAGVGADAMNPF